MIDRKQAAKDTIKAAEGYKAQHITVLDGLAPVRKRPAMYIGSTGSDGLHHMVYEVLDNGIDEAMAGFATRITIEILPDSYIRVEDNGRGIPVDIHKQTGKSALEVVMTKLHAGAKFEKNIYKVSGGLHGVGVSVVNALSEYTKAEVRRDGILYAQEYKKGNPVGRVKKIGKAKETGTIITFKPDREIFPEIIFSFNRILEHVRQQAYLTKGVKFIVIDKRKEGAEIPYAFYFEGGIVSYIKYLNRTNAVVQSEIFYGEKEIDEVKTEVALQYVDDYKENLHTFTNNIHNPAGGTHLAGFRTSLTRTINNYARKKELFKESDENFIGDDLRDGLTAIISIKVKDPQFEGQTKSKLGNPEVKGIVDSAFSELFSVFLEEHPKEAEAIFNKCFLSAKARVAAKKAKDAVLRKGTLEGLSLPGKLADCGTSSPARAELFIVEGDSAGGSCKQGRDREIQAVLPLRGKIINVEKARIDKVLANNEIKSLIIALGTNIGDLFNLDKLRYHKIIIATDADVDGSHIKTLLLTFFYRYLKPIIENGYLYIAKPPLYRIKFGKTIKYVYSEEEKDKFIKSLDKKEKIGVSSFKVKVIGKKESSLAKASDDKEEKEARIDLQRYKGLGEMNPEELFETTMDPQRRILKKIIIEDVTRADEIFEILLGKEVMPRKKFIQVHAKSVQNLDI